ncbi:MAG: hypothetical protein ACD_55C00094G0007 [uncultured bacterium]|uniref:DNA-binding protein n=1 Tax=Citrifermentans bemidjiense (strain ATCC BAA-1014 / DSM 16622 / JCM 12645 / Bem) TaxID=404380 RepID=E1P6E2_CITBB|nr:hypothetical protein [Citrifermentans bemidjiense]ADO00837.1 hypothetical protein Gbem_4137 [Citrifermentans bemidjiense Bem]EKD59271.1 MAG: hypothetical protein ACD_55C00094G0007 [uncultured bacterium]
MERSKSFLTVKQLAEKYPAFTEGALRSLIFHRESNGFAPAVLKLGKKVVLSETAFIEWVEKGGGKSAQQ